MDLQFIYLCGGLGKHKYGTSMFSKPLNYIYGKPLFSYTLKPIIDLSQNIFIIYHDILHEQNLHGEILKQFPNRNIQFYRLPYITRGPLETAYLFIKNMKLQNKPIIFLDNDVIYRVQPHNFENLNYPFIGYSQTDSSQNSNQYCYILRNGNQLTDVQEKNIISQEYGTGIYGFQSPTDFLHLAKEIITTNQLHQNEFFFSTLLQYLLQQKITVYTQSLPPPLTLNTNEQVIQAFQNNPNLFPKLRICFDLDNTLVSYPNIHNDYTTCRPLQDRIQFLRRCKEAGHTIIIHTARRMRTHSGSVSKVIADIGMITLQQLKDFDIPYDEVLFGKPEANFYIDDKAINPYIPEWKHWMGFFDETIHNKIINQLPTNNLNHIVKINDERIHKKGPSSFLGAQAHYLAQIKNIPSIAPMYPQLYGCYEDGELTVIDMEYMQGIPIYKIFQEGLLTTQILSSILAKMSIIHSTKTNQTHSNKLQLVKSNWTDKLQKRLQLPIYQQIPNIHTISTNILNHVTKYTNEMTEDSIADVIHGDFWFSNMIYTFQHEPKFIDPRGKLDQTECLFGDKYYDYAKLYQSILGYDCVINQCELPANQPILKEFIDNYFSEIGVNLINLQWLTKSLILGTIPFLENPNEKILSYIINLIT